MQLHIKVARALRAPLRQVAESGRLSLIDEVSDVLKTLKPAMCALISEYRLSPIEQSTGMWDPTGHPMLQRLEDRIRELCAEPVATKECGEFHKVLEQLRAAMPSTPRA